MIPADTYTYYSDTHRYLLIHAHTYKVGMYLHLSVGIIPVSACICWYIVSICMYV